MPKINLDYLFDHPKTWGILAFIALAATFSPKVNMLASWLCIVFAWVVAIFWIKSSKHSGKLSFILSLVITVVLVLFGLWLIPDKEKESVESQGRIEAKLDILIKQFGDKIDPKKLLNEYPFGYVIFEIDYQNKVFPYDSRILGEYKIDWSNVAITKNTSTEIELRLPEFHKKNDEKHFTALVTGGPKKVGPLGGVSDGELTVWGEILKIERENIVFLVGFSEGPRFHRKQLN